MFRYTVEFLKALIPLYFSDRTQWHDFQRPGSTAAIKREGDKQQLRSAGRLANQDVDYLMILCQLKRLHIRNTEWHQGVTMKSEKGTKMDDIHIIWAGTVILRNLSRGSDNRFIYFQCSWIWRSGFWNAICLRVFMCTFLVPKQFDRFHSNSVFKNLSIID
jgi:hypothetical protein